MDEDLKQLFEGTELAPEFTAKVSSILESRIVEIKEQAESEAEAKYAQVAEDYSKYVVSEMEAKTEKYIDEEFIPVVEKYLDYAVSEFMKENKMVIESQTKVELADAFLKGISGIAEGYNVVVPEGQDDVVTDLKNQLKEANKKFEKALDEANQLKESLVEINKNKLIESVVGDLTETQKERFAESANKVKFISESQYKEALADLKESFKPTDEKESLNEKLDADDKTTDTNVDDDEIVKESATQKWLDNF